jgi:hypothetical protein
LCVEVSEPVSLPVAFRFSIPAGARRLRTRIMRGTGIANSFRSRVCPRRCSAGILSKRDGARAGEENEGCYGRCDFAMHDALLMI